MGNEGINTFLKIVVKYLFRRKREFTKGKQMSLKTNC